MFKNEKKIKLTKNLQKVLHCVPVQNNTYIILAIIAPGKECIMHLDSQGGIIAQKHYTKLNLSQLAVLTQKEVIYLIVDLNVIMHWNLETHQSLEIPFLYHEKCDTHEIILFSKTNTFCIYESGDLNNNAFRLSYFEYPLTKQKDKPFHIYDSQSDAEIWSYGYFVRRGNTQSMIIWFKYKHKDFLQFRTYDLKEKNVKFHKIACQIEHQKFEISIGNIWEVKNNQFMISSVTDRQKKLKNPKDEEPEYPNNILIYNAQQKYLRQAKFALEGKFRLQICQALAFGMNSMFRTFSFNSKDDIQPSPVYYINHETQSIIYIDKWKCTHLNKYETIGYDANILIQNEYQNGHVSQIKITEIKIIDEKEVLVLFLEEYIQNCDEDLIREVVQLICPNK